MYQETQRQQKLSQEKFCWKFFPKLENKNKIKVLKK
jgi:hypothetical protein